MLSFWLRVKTCFSKIELSIMKNFIKCVSINILFLQSVCLMGILFFYVR